MLNLWRSLSNILYLEFWIVPNNSTHGHAPPYLKDESVQEKDLVSGKTQFTYCNKIIRNIVPLWLFRALRYCSASKNSWTTYIIKLRGTQGEDRIVHGVCNCNIHTSSSHQTRSVLPDIQSGSLWRPQPSGYTRYCELSLWRSPLNLFVLVNSHE